VAGAELAVLPEGPAPVAVTSTGAGPFVTGVASKYTMIVTNTTARAFDGAVGAVQPR